MVKAIKKIKFNEVEKNRLKRNEKIKNSEKSSYKNKKNNQIIEKKRYKILSKTNNSIENKFIKKFFALTILLVITLNIFILSVNIGFSESSSYKFNYDANSKTFYVDINNNNKKKVEDNLDNPEVRDAFLNYVFNNNFNLNYEKVRKEVVNILSNENFEMNNNQLNNIMGFIVNNRNTDGSLNDIGKDLSKVYNEKLESMSYNEFKDYASSKINGDEDYLSSEVKNKIKMIETDVDSILKDCSTNEKGEIKNKKKCGEYSKTYNSLPEEFRRDWRVDQFINGNFKGSCNDKTIEECYGELNDKLENGNCDGIICSITNFFTTPSGDYLLKRDLTAYFSEQSKNCYNSEKDIDTCNEKISGIKVDDLCGSNNKEGSDCEYIVKKAKEESMLIEKDDSFFSVSNFLLNAVSTYNAEIGKIEGICEIGNFNCEDRFSFYEGNPFLQEIFGQPIQNYLCMKLIKGYDELINFNGGISEQETSLENWAGVGTTTYATECDNNGVCSPNILSDLRAMRTPITPDNKTYITYSYTYNLRMTGRDSENMNDVVAFLFLVFEDKEGAKYVKLLTEEKNFDDNEDEEENNENVNSFSYYETNFYNYEGGSISSQNTVIEDLNLSKDEINGDSFYITLLIAKGENLNERTIFDNKIFSTSAKVYLMSTGDYYTEPTLDSDGDGVPDSKDNNVNSGVGSAPSEDPEDIVKAFVMGG